MFAPLRLRVPRSLFSLTRLPTPSRSASLCITNPSPRRPLPRSRAAFVCQSKSVAFAVARRDFSASVALMSPINDPNTLSNHHALVTDSTSVNVVLNFDAETVSGDVTFGLNVLQDGVSEIVLDTSYLDIKNVVVDGAEAKWSLAPRNEPFGSALSIALSGKPKIGDSIEAKITYTTTDKCTALQWMAPAQTSNKKHPYMCLSLNYLAASLAFLTSCNP